MTSKEQIARAMTALSHPRRVAIFEVLENAGSRGLGVEELMRSAGLRPSTLNHHLRPMIAAGLVRKTRVGLPTRLQLDGAAARNIVAEMATRMARAERPARITSERFLRHTKGTSVRDANSALA